MSQVAPTWGAALLADLAALVEVETPTGDAAACAAGLSVLAERLRARTGRLPRTVEAGGRAHLHLPAAGGRARVLLLGHIDTVWPAGTLARWPLSVDGDRVTGPGVFDMKGGLAMGLAALATCTRPADVAVLVTSDEETGSATSQELIEAVAADADAVLVLEPAAPGGAPKGARKGVSMHTVRLQGRAAHAGLEPEAGRNALLALAEVVPAIAALTDPAAGTTATPTTAAAGTTRNTVPATAWVHVDVRAWTTAELQRVRGGLAALAGRATAAGVAVEVVDDGWRPPLEAAGGVALAALHATCRADLDLPPLPPVAVGGGSDGNFTAALGVPTLDGLGAVGDGAHAEGEHLLLRQTVAAARVLTALLDHLTT